MYNAVMTFTKASYAILTVLVFHSILLFTDGYFLIPGIDGPMHFAGGFAMGMLGLAVHHCEILHARTKHVSGWYHFLFVISFVALIAVLWEFHEYVLDHTFTVWMGWPQAQVSLQDTMADLMLGLIGGAIAFLCFRKAN